MNKMSLNKTYIINLLRLNFFFYFIPNKISFNFSTVFYVMINDTIRKYEIKEKHKILYENRKKSRAEKKDSL